MAKKEKPNKERKIVFNIRKACEDRGIKNPHQLWLKFGGSKATTASFWHDEDLTQIQLKTINTLCNLLDCEPADLFRVVD